MYVTQADYRGRINSDLLLILIAEDPIGICNDASKTAEDTIASMAGQLYDIVPEFAKTGNNRNFFVLGMALHIALYNIYQRADDEQIPEKIIKNYDDTIEDLVKISLGKMSLNLPPASIENTDGNTPGNSETPATTGKGLRRFGSQLKRTHRI